MKKLYLQTKNGTFPIDQSAVEKYGLKPGTTSPFSNGRIVDSQGKAPPNGEGAQKHEPNENPRGELAEGEISEMENGMTLSTSEIIDFSQGVDSSNN